MIYNNKDDRCLIEMEYHRLCSKECDFVKECPVCYEEDPEYFYIDKFGECIGCSECIEKIDYWKYHPE